MTEELLCDCKGCGTYSGYQRHIRKSETTCSPCRKACAEYMRKLRASRPDIRTTDRRTNSARSRALWRLADRYPDEFQRLWLDELAKDPR